mmetsp:Transcript_5810/g.5265  ORF Transcript_5810/g.5265 Transcript_5810/m.5265 type:complete len:102 (+) Transcript_5810:134-439(+)
MQTVLKDGRRFGLSFQDGMGSEFHSHDKATEDFILIEGQHYKMDIMRMEYNKRDYMEPRTLYTIGEVEYFDKVFPKRHCQLTFTPEEEIRDGLNLVLVAFK